MAKRSLNPHKPHLLQREKGWWVCNFPGSGRKYLIGDGTTAVSAYDNWYQKNQDRLQNPLYDRSYQQKLPPAIRSATLDRLYDHTNFRNVGNAPSGVFPTSHQREP